MFIENRIVMQGMIGAGLLLITVGFTCMAALLKYIAADKTARETSSTMQSIGWRTAAL